MYESHTEETESLWRPLESADDECFGCGPDNSHGLQMRFESNGSMLRSRLKMDSRHRGWSNLIHGGILSTMLDETMGWTVIILTRRFMLTKTMAVSFHRPVRIGAQLTITGFFKEQPTERRALVRAEIHDEHGELCAAADGEFALFSKKQFLRMKIMSEEDIEAMEAAANSGHKELAEAELN